MASVLNRDKHPTFDKLSPDNKLSVVMSFWGEFQPGNVGNGIERVMSYNCLSDSLPAINSSLENFLTTYKTRVSDASNSFQVKPIEEGHLIFKKAILEYTDIGDWRQIPIDSIESFIRSPTCGPKMPNSSQEILKKGYIAVEIPSVHQDTLQNWITKKYFGEKPPPSHTRTFLHHITLIHSNNQNNDRWDQTMELCRQEVEVDITDVFLGKLESSDSFDSVVLQVSLTREKSNSNDIVSSGFPHITGILPKSQMPLFSVKFVADQHYLIKETISIEDKNKLRFRGKIRWYH